MLVLDIHVHIHVYYTHTISYALIIRYVIDIGHYQALFLKDIIISILIMSFLVMVTSIAFMILIIIEKCTFLFKESETRMYM